MKKKIILTEEKIVNKDYEEKHITIPDFDKNLNIQILSSTADKLEMQINHIDPPIANALRRIMIADIPTMAIHKVLVMQNTSVIPDEVLSHRLGLIPIKADPKLFQFKKEQDDYNERNSIKFELSIKCQRKPKYKDQKIDIVVDNPEEYYTNTTVFASDLKWIPQGMQKETFEQSPIQPVHPNIIIAKLRENQEIHLELICEKGIGKQHAKWSPVATTFYKLLPEITLKKQFTGERAQQLKTLCPVGVFDIEENTAVVKNPMKCTSCRQCIREDFGFKDYIELAKVNDVFICNFVLAYDLKLVTIESVGIYKPHEIFLEAIDVLKRKATQYQTQKQ